MLASHSREYGRVVTFRGARARVQNTSRELCTHGHTHHHIRCCLLVRMHCASGEDWVFRKDEFSFTGSRPWDNILTIPCLTFLHLYDMGIVIGLF